MREGLRTRIRWFLVQSHSHLSAPEAGGSPCSWVSRGLSPLPAGSLRVSPPPAGSLIQVPMSEKGKITRGRLGSLSLKKEGERQCFLFSKHLIICTRGSGGKLHLTKVGPRGRGRSGGLGPRQALTHVGKRAGTGVTHEPSCLEWLVLC